MGGSTLSDLDNIIADSIKADASFITGLGQPDDKPTFPGPSQVIIV